MTLAEAAAEHSRLLEAWLAATGNRAVVLKRQLDKARVVHRRLDEEACADSIPPCWRKPHWL